MAHMVESMAYAGETPWHGLGVAVSNDLSPDEMRKTAGLHWEIEEKPTFITVPDGAGGFRNEYTGEKAIVRNDTYNVLTTASDSWHALSVEKTFEFFHDFVKNGDMEMNTAGSLQNGQIIWALAKLKGSAFDLFNKKDVTETYLLLSNRIKYGTSIACALTPVRVVCHNTITLAEKSIGAGMRQNHTKPFDAEKAKLAIGMSKEKMIEYKEKAEFLAKIRFAPENVMEYYNTLFPNYSKKEEKKNQPSRAANEIKRIIDIQPGAKFGEGTFWQLFNSVTFYCDHLAGRNDNTRLAATWFGPNRDLKLESLNLAMEMAKKAA